MLNRRKIPRNHLYEFFKTVDRNTNQLIGHLTDISVEGINLITNQKIEPYQVYELKVLLPEYMKYESISLDVICVWCNTELPDYVYRAGFQLLKISIKDKEVIESVF
ncbi:MAG: PilZ domain-containing protein [Candidatus Aureabacteria bacterium]|nr:PilZ domain-containing protein [Candidatus Auribacterota bacterium]